MYWEYLYCLLCFTSSSLSAYSRHNPSTPNVVIAGGGPGGIFAAIMLSKLGINTTVLEQSIETEQWSSRSYSIFLNERGEESLKKGGCINSVANAGLLKKSVIFLDGQTGEEKIMPKKGISISRPNLVLALKKVLEKEPNARLIQGTMVDKVSRIKRNNSDSSIHVQLSNGSEMVATHVIAADGKWSRVRQCLPEIQTQSNIRTEPSFGVSIHLPHLPDGWRKDTTYVINPEGCKFYLIASPMSSGGASLSMVCFEEMLKQYPWLRRSKGSDGNLKRVGWEDVYSCNKSSQNMLSENLASLFQEKIPYFYSIIDKDALRSARINRPTSWLEMHRRGEDVTYTSKCGRVTLVGDAAHAVTPSIGEGCNMALESVSKLSDEIVLQMKESGTTKVDVDMLSRAFHNFGARRPIETIPIQMRSAAASRSMRR